MFYHLGWDVSALVHGDDFVFVGEDGPLNEAEGLLTRRFEMKVRGRLGGGSAGPEGDGHFGARCQVDGRRGGIRGGS